MEILETLSGLGVEVKLIGDRLRFHPASRIPPDLVSQIREQKPAIIEALRSRPTKAENRIGCRYDWQPGYRGLRLYCVAHHHVPGAATVLRLISSGRDVLLEMEELGILSGEALADARRVN